MGEEAELVVLLGGGLAGELEVVLADEGELEVVEVVVEGIELVRVVGGRLSRHGLALGDAQLVVGSSSRS